MDPIENLARVSRRPSRADSLLVGALSLWAILEAALAAGPGPRWARVVFALGITVPLLARRRASFQVSVLLSVVIVGWTLHASRPETGTMPLPCVLVAVFSVALYTHRAVLAVGGGIGLLATMLLVLKDFYAGPPSAANLAILAFFFCGSWAAGWLVRRRAAQAHRAVARSGELARSAVVEERARIARELHDVVAHSISIIAVQAGAAEALIDRDADRARDHIGLVRITARETMTEMRRLLDVLRTDEIGYAPQPGLARLGDLLAEADAAGLTVELVEDGERPHLPAGLDLVAFRIVQESLTNARKHGEGAAARCWLRYRASAIEIEIVNGVSADDPSNRTDGGHGLIGMRERASLFGGSFEAGVRDDGSFHVRAVLPISEEAT